MKNICLIIALFVLQQMHAQKKVLDHTVYDNWQSIGDKAISNNGRYIAYNILPQDGDAVLEVKDIVTNNAVSISRGYDFKFTANNHFLICKIKPFFKDLRTAKIKKLKTEGQPMDSLLILRLADFNLFKLSKIKSYLLSEKTGDYLTVLLNKSNEIKNKPDEINDSILIIQNIQHKIDSLQKLVGIINEKGIIQFQKLNSKQIIKSNTEKITEGNIMFLFNLTNFNIDTFKLVKNILLDKSEKYILIETTKSNVDSTIKTDIQLLNLITKKKESLLQNFYDSKNFVFNDSATSIAFIASKDTQSNILERKYNLYSYNIGDKKLLYLENNHFNNIKHQYQLSASANVKYNSFGTKLFFEIKPNYIMLDTSLPEFERVKLDIWHYNDEQLQPIQLKNLNNDLNKGLLASWNLENQHLQLLQDSIFDKIIPLQNYNEQFIYAIQYTNKIAQQWQGFSKQKIFCINTITNEKYEVNNEFKGNVIVPNKNGHKLVFYDEIKKKYFCYDGVQKKIITIASDIKFHLFDEDNDIPDDPNGYGVVKYLNDTTILIYDKYDIWQVDVNNAKPSVVLTSGRKNNKKYRFIELNKTEKIKTYFEIEDSSILLTLFNEQNKNSGISRLHLKNKTHNILVNEAVYINPKIDMAKNNNSIIFTKETYQQSPNLYYIDFNTIQNNYSQNVLSQINIQQNKYFWGTAELFKWKSYTGKLTEGILYKPENFDTTKKYPMIVYFYERNNSTLYQYIPPAPSPSRLNISFFVSRGYVVFVPDIWYTIPNPGNSAYNYIVSGTRAVIKKGFIDSTKIGLQGQSWGGYQIAYLITKTNLFACAWAGAPVVNMTSAYGGIRWGTGLNRQFQYEKTQSRIGKTLWENTNAYLQNSPLFFLPKVSTPVVIMSNDADDAVPWYQGIEMFTALRRLNKKVWLLNYNNEAHNLLERRNRKDISIREQQFFDYYLKNEKPAKWIIEGIPATMKGRTLGLNYTIKD